MKNFPFVASVIFSKRTLTPVVAALTLAYLPLGHAQMSDNTSTIQGEASAQQVAIELDFTSVDLDENGFLNWAEIEAIYDDSLSSLEWDRDKVFAIYDSDVNEKLDKEEFREFVSQLQREVEIQMKEQS